MSLFRNPTDHKANPPSTWVVVKSGSRWNLQIAKGATIQQFERKRDAESAKESGMWVTLYNKEARWYAGEPVDNWRSYVDCQAGTNSTREDSP